MRSSDYQAGDDAFSIGVANISHFDFVVAQRPRYIPGSGPEVEDPTIMPVHDKDGIIDGKLHLEGEKFRYVVTYKDKPHLRVSVQPDNILDWVSPRTFERYI